MHLQVGFGFPPSVGGSGTCVNVQVKAEMEETLKAHNLPISHSADQEDVELHAPGSFLELEDLFDKNGVEKALRVRLVHKDGSVICATPLEARKDLPVTHFFVEDDLELRAPDFVLKFEVSDRDSRLTSCKDHPDFFDVEPTSVEHQLCQVLLCGRKVVIVVVRGWRWRSCSSGSPVRQQGGDGGGERLAEAVMQQQQPLSHNSFPSWVDWDSIFGCNGLRNPGIAGNPDLS
eukprot:2285980-Karenia_brevis.AAC.1